MSQKTILVIDDDPLVRRTIERILHKKGYRVYLAADGSQGLQAFQHLRPDLVITDIVMPLTDGLETIRSLRTWVPDARIIAISGGNRSSKGDLLAQALSLGAGAVIAKPFAPDELLFKVSQNLQGGLAATRQ
jgi:two-component system chemotaxis response regulator CheY